MIKKPLGIAISLLAFLFLLAPAAMAASLDLQVSTGQQPSARISSCPDTVLSDIDVLLTNLGGQTDTFELTLDWPADLGFIKPFQTLASGESANIKPFWITLPYNLEPGIYHAKVTAESSMTGDKVTKDIEIEILRCRSVMVNIEDNYERSCRETLEPVTYDLVIVNEGKWDETFELSASVDWADFTRDTVTVSSGGSEEVSFVLNPPESLASGKHTVFVTARSLESYAVATADGEVELEDCFGFDASLEPGSLTTCVSAGRDFELIITNSGEDEDEYLVHGTHSLLAV